MISNPIQDTKTGFFITLGSIAAISLTYVTHQLAAGGWAWLTGSSCPVNARRNPPASCSCVSAEQCFP